MAKAMSVFMDQNLICLELLCSLLNQECNVIRL